MRLVEVVRRISVCIGEYYFCCNTKSRPEISEDDWKAYMDIIRKARFSKEDLTEEEFEKCTDI